MRTNRQKIELDIFQGIEVLDQNSNVVAAWVFGSGQTGTIRAGGDLDIGVLYDQMPDLDELVTLLMALQDAYDFDDIDLVTLNQASPILRFEAISGKNIFKRDLLRFAEFFALTAREYEYSMALLQRGMAARQEYRRQAASEHQ